MKTKQKGFWLAEKKEGSLTSVRGRMIRQVTWQLVYRADDVKDVISYSLNGPTAERSIRQFADTANMRGLLPTKMPRCAADGLKIKPQSPELFEEFK